MLCVMLGVRSQTRRSVISSAVFTAAAGDAAEAGDTGTRIHLQDFHRVEVKNGVTVWEVQAKDALYYAQEKVAHINDSSVIVYREDRSKVQIRSAAAKLLLDEQSIERAELQGNIEVALAEGVRIAADIATYDAVSRQIDAPGNVIISGEGYEVRGKRLTLDVEGGVVKLAQDVYSRFLAEAKAPSLGKDGLLPLPAKRTRNET